MGQLINVLWVVLTYILNVFDCLNHKLFNAKLNAHGNIIPKLKLEYDFLSNKKQRTKLHDKYSDTMIYLQFFKVPYFVHYYQIYFQSRSFFQFFFKPLFKFYTPKILYKLCQNWMKIMCSISVVPEIEVCTHFGNWRVLMESETGYCISKTKLKCNNLQLYSLQTFSMQY